MIKIKKLQINNITNCLELICSEYKDSLYFKNLGWSENQLVSQFKKKVNYSFGSYYNKKLVGFLIGDLIFIEKVSEYEILFIYVKKIYRRKGVGNHLINNILAQRDTSKLKKIFLEVSEDNMPAIELYKKNNFKLINIRKNYYSNENKNFNALCFSKVVST